MQLKNGMEKLIEEAAKKENITPEEWLHRACIDKIIRCYKPQTPEEIFDEIFEEE